MSNQILIKLGLVLFLLFQGVILTQAQHKQDYSQLVADSVYRKDANAFFGRGYYVKSLNCCKQIPDSLRSEEDWLLMGRCYERQAFRDSAIICQKQALLMQPQNANTVISIAKNCVDLGDYELAEYYADSYIFSDSTNLLVNSVKAYALYEQGKYPKALNEYKRLKALGDNQYETNYYMGLCFARTDDIKSAYECLKLANEQTHSRNPYILSQYGIMANNLARTKEGIEAVDNSILLLQPDSTLMYSLYRSLSDAYLYNRQFGSSIATLRQAMALHEKLSDYYQLGNLYHMNKDEKNAEKYITLFIDRVAQLKNDKPYRKQVEDASSLLKYIREEMFFKQGK